MFDYLSKFSLKEIEHKGLGVCTLESTEPCIIPMVTIACSERQTDMKYSIEAHYLTKKGTLRAVKDVVLDGNPQMLKHLDLKWKIACFANEPGPQEKPNAILIVNPYVTERDIIKSCILRKPFVSHYLCVKGLGKNEEVLWNYGDVYERNYPVWTYTAAVNDALVHDCERMFDHVDVITFVE